jgi:hypothetical protein
MSKFLITERELRNALFKSFLKNPNLLKETPNPPTEREKKIAAKDQISPELARIVKTSAISQMNAERKKDLTLLTLRRQYLDNNYIFKLDVGASIFDHFVSDFKKEDDWDKANLMMQGGYEQWLQKSLETFQISTGVAPMVSTKLVKNRAFYFVDALANTYSAMNNYLFSEFLEDKKDIISYLKKYKDTLDSIKKDNDKNIITKNGIKNFILNSIDDQNDNIKNTIQNNFNRETITKYQKDIGNIDIILGLDDQPEYPSLIWVLERNQKKQDDESINENELGKTDFKIEIGKDVEERSIEKSINMDDIGNEDWWYFTYAICDALSLIPYAGFLVDAGLNAGVKKNILDNLASNKNKEARLYAYDAKTDTWIPKGTNTAENVDTIDDETYAARPEAKSQAPFTTDQVPDEMRSAIDKTMQDMAEASARGTTINKDSANYKNMVERYMAYFYDALTKKITEWADNEKIKNILTGLDYNNPTLNVEGKKEKLMQFYKIVTSDQYKINNPEIYDIFKKIELNTSNPNINKNLNAIIDDVINNVDNAELDRNPILEILLKNNFKGIDINNVSLETLKKFIDNCVQYSGMTEDQILKRIQEYITDTVSRKIKGQDVAITIDNVGELYELIQKSKDLGDEISPLKRALKGALNEVYEITKGKSIPTNIKSINEIFPESIQKEYFEKMKKIKDIIMSSISDETVRQLINVELKKIPMQKSKIKSILKEKNIIIHDIDKFIDLYARNQGEVFEYLLDCHFFINMQKNAKTLDVRLVMNQIVDNKDLLALLPDSIALQTNTFTVYRQLYEKLKESNKFQKYFYNQKLTRFYNAMNSQKASTFEVLNDLASQTTNSRYIETYEAFTKKAEELKIPKLIDGTLKISADNVEVVATNVRQFHLFLMKFLKRYILTFELISNPKKVTQTEYIEDLINYKILEQDGGDVLNFAADKDDNFLKIWHSKIANEGMDMSKESTGVFKKLKKMLLSFFSDDSVYAKVPELIQNHQELAKIVDINKNLKINGITPRNLAMELKNIDQFMPKIITIIDEEIEIINKRINQIKTSGIFANDEEKLLEIALCEVEIELLTTFRKETVNFINHTRKNSAVGEQGYRIINQGELLPETQGGKSPGAIQKKSGFDEFMELASLPRLEQDRLLLLDKIYKFFKNMQTGFKDRFFKMLASKLTAFDVDNTTVTNVITSFFGGFLKKSFAEGLQHVLPTKNKIFSLNNLHWISAIASGIHSGMVLGVVANVGILSCLMGMGFATFHAFVFGYFSKVILRLLSSKVEALQKMAEGMLSEIITTSSKILKQILKYTHSYEDEYRRLSIQKFESSDAYMERVFDIAHTEDKTQHTILGKSIYYHVKDLFTSKQYKKKELIKGAKSMIGENDLFTHLDRLYEQYIELGKSFLQVPNNFGNGLFKEINDIFGYIFSSIDTSSQSDAQSNNTIFVANFKLAVVYLLFMQSFEENGGTLKDDVKGSMDGSIYDLLAKMYQIRKNLKGLLRVIGNDLQLLDNTGFNVDSLITGGWYNIKMNRTNFNYSFAEQYSYQITAEGNIPHFKKETSITEKTAEGGSEKVYSVNNLALEIYSFYEAANTHSLELISIPHSYLFKPLRDIYYTFQLGLNQLQDLQDGTPQPTSGEN